MKLETFIDNFEVLAEAPNALKNLREMILELAVRGKLVPQDEKDEPASVLLEKIKAERELLIKEKTIKKLNSMPIEVNDIPYDLPVGWKWARLGDLGQTQTGTTPSKSNPDFFGKDYPFLKPGDISDNFVEYNNEGLSSIGIENGRLIKAGSILMVCIGGSIGKVNWVDRDCSCNQQINVLTPFLNLDSRFLTYFMRSRYFQDEVILTAPQTTLPILSKGKWELIPFPLPPLKEQHRIVAKVDQLMSLCDELEARQQKKRETRAHLNSAALDRLLTACAPGEFAEGWRRISDNFDLLYDAPENVGALRQAILQLAVMGKLVEQDEKEETALVLLEKIKAEKEQLIKEKKIKKDEKLPVLTESNVPHQLPSSWQWISLGEVIDYNSGQKVSPSEIPEDAWLLDLEDIEKDTSKIIQRLTAKERASKSTKAKFGKGDVLYGKLRPYLNKVVVADSDGFCTTEIVPLRIYYGISPKYLMYSLKRPDFLSYVNSKTYGVKMPRLGTNDAQSAPFPLPPLAEQHRIVARVDQLMSLCDELEAGLLRSQADSEKLMEAVVGRMLAGGDNA